MYRSSVSSVLLTSDAKVASVFRELEKEGFPLTMVKQISESGELLASYNRYTPDLIIIDLDSTGIKAFELMKQIRFGKPEILFILLSSTEDFTLLAIKAAVSDYMVKPLTRQVTLDAITKIDNKHGQAGTMLRIRMLEQLLFSRQRLSFITRRGMIFVNPDDIFYIEADCNYSDICFSKNHREVVSLNIGAVESILPWQFIRINRSIIINTNYLNKIAGVSRSCLISKDGEEIEFSIPEKQLAGLKRRLFASLPKIQDIR